MSMDYDRVRDIQSSTDPPQYDGEDTRPTSKKELSGWYSYGWAAEVCALTSPFGIVI